MKFILGQKKHDEMSESQKAHLKRAEIISRTIEQDRIKKYERLDSMSNQEVIDEMTENSKNCRKFIKTQVEKPIHLMN